MHRLYSKISSTLYKTISSQVTFISKSLSKYIKNFLSKNNNHKNFSHRMWLVFEMKYKCLDFLLVSFDYYYSIHLAYEKFWITRFFYHIINFQSKRNNFWYWHIHYRQTNWNELQYFSFVFNNPFLFFHDYDSHITLYAKGDISSVWLLNYIIIFLYELLIRMN